jgi:bifunctional oligoribonuclease and PAP phosphatase NrnA
VSIEYGLKIFIFAPRFVAMTHLHEFSEFLRTPRRIVIITHHKPDADALGSSLGLCAYLKKTSHSPVVVTPSDYPAFLHWMPGNNEVIIHDEKTDARICRLVEEAEMIFCLDFSALSRINHLGEVIRHAKAKKVLIDHHLEPEHFADFEQWNVQSASTAGLVYELIIALGHREWIDAEIANCLYAGLMTDTGGFRHSNTRHEEFTIAADLVAHGANPTKVAKLIYDTNTLERLRLTGYVLQEKLTVLPEYRTAYIVLTQEELKKFGSQTGDTEGFVNYGLSIQGIRLAVMIHERKDEIKLSFRSLGDFSVNEMARKHFNGGGHKNAAGGLSKTSLTETINHFLTILPDYREQLLSGYTNA